MTLKNNSEAYHSVFYIVGTQQSFAKMKNQTHVALAWPHNS